jgi:hypothetical protein
MVRSRPAGVWTYRLKAEGARGYLRHFGDATNPEIRRSGAKTEIISAPGMAQGPPTGEENIIVSSYQRLGGS